MKSVAQIAVVLAGLVAGGCGSLLAPPPDLTQYFVLEPVGATQPQAASDAAQRENLRLGLGPLNFPEYLGRMQVVTRAGVNRLKISQRDRWAEPLDRNFSRVLAQDLSVRLGTREIFRHPGYAGVPLDYEIPIDVLQFEGDANGTARLHARWLVREGHSNKVLFITESRIEEPASQPGTAGMVAALSVTIDRLSAEIANAVRSLQAQAE